MKHPGISVIICCHNSEGRIGKTLNHLLGQELNEKINWEIIVIDNVSKDKTLELVRHKLNSFKALNFSFQIHREEKLGLNYARLKGIECAKYNYLLFCDDDNWLTEDYISKGFDILRSNPKIGVLGGLAIPVFESEKPGWFDQYQLYFAVGSQSNITGDISKSKGWVYGAAFFINKTALTEISSYNFVTTDRRGNDLSSGGDIEICYYIILKGYKVWYSEELKFYHYMTNSKLNINYLKRLMVAGAKNAYILEGMYYKAVQPTNYLKLKKNWIFKLLIDAPRIKDFTGDKNITMQFKFKLHLLRIKALLKLNFTYNKSFK